VGLQEVEAPRISR